MPTPCTTIPRHTRAAPLSSGALPRTSADAYSLLSFGGGAHRCIGASLAQLEMKIVLREILARLDLAPVSDALARPVPRGPTLAPRGGSKGAGPRAAHPDAQRHSNRGSGLRKRHAEPASDLTGEQVDQRGPVQPPQWWLSDSWSCSTDLMSATRLPADAEHAATPSTEAPELPPRERLLMPSGRRSLSLSTASSTNCST